MYITNDLDIALIAQKYGVNRIWVDLEILGKEERQKGLNTVKSQHKIDDISRIKPYLNTSEMLVRVNPWHDESIDEINKVIDAGADVIMLPYWKTLEEVKCFIDAVNGRCKTTLLLETKEAVDCIDEVLKDGGFDEIHIGLNDLHLSYGKTFMFELLADGTVEMLCNKFKNAGIPYGFGGIAKIGEGLLPAEKVVMEHYRLGSTRAIVSRTFCNYTEMNSIAEVEQVFCEEINKLRGFEKTISSLTVDDYNSNRLAVIQSVETIVNTIKAKQNGVDNNG